MTTDRPLERVLHATMRSIHSYLCDALVEMPTDSSSDALVRCIGGPRYADMLAALEQRRLQLFPNIGDDGRLRYSLELQIDGDEWRVIFEVRPEQIGLAPAAAEVIEGALWDQALRDELGLGDTGGES